MTTGFDDQLALSGVSRDRLTMPRSLVERFGVPPFTVLDTRQGYWQQRKRSWLSLGIQSELGRKGADGSGDGLTFGAGLGVGETSVFDPVLCELAYRWFSPPSARVLDPFAGGSVRGIVATALGRSYLGIELSVEQVRANRVQAARIFGPEGVDMGEPVIPPHWEPTDAMALDDVVERPCDFIFTCPPYADLEVYSDDPRDLSTMPYGKFQAAMHYIIAAAVGHLRDDRFACIVVGDVRDKVGHYRGLTAQAIEAFEAAGMAFYNEAILLNAVGSAAVRVTKQFETSRKLAMLHQHVLVFVKGDPRRATKACAPEAADV